MKTYPVGLMKQGNPEYMCFKIEFRTVTVLGLA
jgi:hypothetical protein